MKINLPTRLTLFRIVVIPPFLIFLIHDNPFTRLAALILFILASITDYYDGQLARKMKAVTTLGQFLDPLADKLLIITPLIAFVQISEIHVPAWMVVLIIGREFLITGLRSIAASQGRIIPAQPAGKFKTTSQMVSIITILVILTVNSFLEDFFGLHKGSLIQRTGPLGLFGWILDNGPYWLVLGTTVLTIFSGTIYLKDNHDLLNDQGH